MKRQMTLYITEVEVDEKDRHASRQRAVQLLAEYLWEENRIKTYELDGAMCASIEMTAVTTDATR